MDDIEEFMRLKNERKQQGKAWNSLLRQHTALSDEDPEALVAVAPSTDAAVL